jgi:hypothetical protein
VKTGVPNQKGGGGRHGHGEEDWEKNGEFVHTSLLAET